MISKRKTSTDGADVRKIKTDGYRIVDCQLRLGPYFRFSQTMCILVIVVPDMSGTSCGHGIADSSCAQKPYVCLEIPAASSSFRPTKNFGLDCARPTRVSSEGVWDSDRPCQSDGFGKQKEACSDATPLAGLLSLCPAHLFLLGRKLSLQLPREQVEEIIKVWERFRIVFKL